MSTSAESDFEVLHEFASKAKQNLKLGSWDYLIGGAETETTLRRNRQAIEELTFRPRVLRDVSNVNPAGRVAGIDLRIPVVLAPIGSLQDFWEGGGATAAQGAQDFGVVSMLSSACQPGVEAVASAAPGDKIYQLYVRGDQAWVDERLQLAVEHGYGALCLTVDLDYYSRRERDLAKRYVTSGRRQSRGGEEQMRFTWKDIERIRSKFSCPLILKGIATAEDANIACEHGVDVVYVSNHGGRQLDHGRGSLEVVPEVVDAVGERAQVMVDGGFLRGTDVVKAMILGVSAVGVGRLCGYALAAAGRPGVVRMLEILEHEICIALGLLGVNDYSELDSSYLHHSARPVSDSKTLSGFPLLDEGY